MLPATANRPAREAQPVTIPVVGREAFLRDYWDYGNGNHVTFLGPTQRGKTTWAIELLKASISPQRHVTILSGKPPGRDPALQVQAAKTLNLRVIEDWPPLPMPGDRKRNGFVLQPRQSMRDLKADEDNMREEFRKAIVAAYASSKPNILMVDEAHLIQVDLGLKREYEAPLMRGAPVTGVWSLIQRGRYISYHAYSAPEHIFIFSDPDESNRQRYSEIGGVDPKLLFNIVSSLKVKRLNNERKNSISECLYIRRSGPELVIVKTD